MGFENGGRLLQVDSTFQCSKRMSPSVIRITKPAIQNWGRKWRGSRVYRGVATGQIMSLFDGFPKF